MSGFYRKMFLANNQRGSFLLEALIAVVVLSVGLVGLIRGLLSSLNVVKQAQEYSQAIEAADNALLEVIRLNGQKTSPNVSLQTDDKNLALQIILNEPKNTVIPSGLQQAQVKVKWPGALKQKEIDAVTLVFKPLDGKE